MTDKGGVFAYEMCWEEFRQHCLDRKLCGSTSDQVVYRGQMNSKWALEPTLSRLRPDLSVDDYIASIIPRSYRQISGYLDHDMDLTKAGDVNRLLGILQHHGFPTPLLDWTRSPYIAAYFAFAGLAFSEPQSDRVTVWALAIDFAPKFLSDKGVAVPFSAITPDHRYNQRLLAQDGLFTRSHAAGPLDTSMVQLMAEHTHPGLLQRVDLDASQARQALADLRLMGVHAGTLFPGLTGACEGLRQDVFMEQKTLMTPSTEKLMGDRIKRSE